MAISDFKTVLQMDPQDKQNRDILNDLLFESERYNELIEAGKHILASYQILMSEKTTMFRYTTSYFCFRKNRYLLRL